MDKHLILTNGRSGSNYFVTLLNRHPQVTNYGEVLGNWMITFQLYKLGQKLPGTQISVEKYLDLILSSPAFFQTAQVYSALAKLGKGEKPNFKSWGQIKSLGVKDFSINFIKRGVADYFQQRPYLKVINLYRSNSLRRLISLEAMKNTGVIGLERSQKAKTSTVFLPTENLLERLALYDREKQDQFALLQSFPKENVLEIEYETYFQSEESQRVYNDRVFELLGVEPLPLEGKHRKILPQSLEATLTNYAEVRQALQGTSYETFLLD
ncbi:MAG: hypothetical protein GC158_05185 [Cyanobacteria bacterium RI_101]|nr:hypothetical protein [Cyanobacteria bacterium RI_101]